MSELLSLKISYVDTQKRFAVVKGKGRKERLIFFGNLTAELITKLLIARRLTIGDFSDDDYLFAFKNRSPLNKSDVGKAWRNAQRKAGLSPLPFHGLRHGFARQWITRNGDIITLQILLGYASESMVRRYVTLWGHDLETAYKRISPIDNLFKKRR